MTIRLVKHETGDYTYDTETREWTKSSIMKDRLKNVLGIEIRTKNPIDVELSLDSKIHSNPSNFYPELSPDYEFFRSTRKSRWG